MQQGDERQYCWENKTEKSRACCHGYEDEHGEDGALLLTDASPDGKTMKKSKDKATLKVRKVAGSKDVPFDEGGTPGSTSGSRALVHDLVSGSTEVPC